MASFNKDFLIKKYFSPKNLKDAFGIQADLKKMLKIIPLKRKLKRIACIDVSFKEDVAKGAIVVESFPEGKILEEKTLLRKLSFPYIPGLFAFREGPLIIELFYSLKNRPDLIILDAQGIAHPRGLGLASQVGVVLNTPSIGVSKSNLYGYYEEPSLKKGSFSFIYHPQTKEKIGLLLRTKDKTRPLFISPGHLVNLKNCLDVLLKLSGNFRIPDILRAAHRLSSFKS